MSASTKIKAGIVGGAGYTGGELLRILLDHPFVDLSFVHSRSQVGKEVSSIHTDLAGETEIRFTGELRNNIDVLFLCVGHGEARKFLESNEVHDSVRIIDLSQDFRLENTASFGKRKFIYGLPESNRDLIRTASNIANPGCFATAIQLALLPLAKEGILKEVHTTGITGSTGAGQGLSATSHFSWRANNIQAYKTLTHQHLKEINQTLGGTPVLNFVPWRGDFTRGIFTSSTISCNLSEQKITDIYEQFYTSHPFCFISKDPISLKQVVNTNRCAIQLEKVEDHLVIHSAIDNLLKGASGQAVQNMNLMFGFEETAGIKLKPVAF